MKSTELIALWWNQATLQFRRSLQRKLRIVLVIFCSCPFSIKFIYVLSPIYLSWLPFFLDQVQQIWLHLVRNLNQSCTFSHYISFLDTTSNTDIIFYGLPFIVLNHQVLASLIKNSWNQALALKLFDFVNDFFGWHLESMTEIFKKGQFVFFEESD